MIDEDGIERPDDPNAHMVENPVTPRDKDIGADYKYINHNIIFRLWSRVFRRVGIFIMGKYIKHKYKLRVLGKKNLKFVRKQGCMVTINHVHQLDNVLVGARILKHRKCYFITLKDNINMPFLGFILKSVGGLPIPTSTKAMPAFEKAVDELLAKKKAVLICPEASLWPYYRGVRPFKKGAFRFAVRNNVPILPIVISFRRKLRRKQTPKGKYKYYFTAMIGHPLYQDETKTHRNERIEDLKNRTYQFYVNTVEDFYKDEERRSQNDYLEPLLPQFLLNKEKDKK